MKYAIVTIGSKQYRIEEGTELVVEKLSAKVGENIIFNSVNLLVEDKKTEIGQPYLANISITAEVVAHKKDNKIRVATYKAKSRYRKVKGHRQNLTQIKIKKISLKRNQKKRSKSSKSKKQQ